MAIVSLQIGQCGNQIGADLFNTIYDDCFNQTSPYSTKLNQAYLEDAIPTFFDQQQSGGSLKARCVQIDMEEKVITRLRQKAHRSGRWTYPKDNYYTDKCGSGNNWALGYFVHGNHIHDRVGNLIQTQLECCDSVDGLLISMSLAGGTGSGLGTKLLGSLPDLLPKVPTLTQLIWPHQQGEVSVQSYNAILTLGHLLASSSSNVSSLDGFVMHHNDTLHAICSNRLLASNPQGRIGMDQLNALISYQMAGLLQPITSPSTGFYSKRLSSLLIDLCGHPDYRLLRCRSLPYMASQNQAFATETWAQLVRHARQMILTGSSVEDKLDWSITSSGSGAKNRHQAARLPLLAYVATLRGKDADEHIENPDPFVHDLTKDLIAQSSIALSPLLSSTLFPSSRPIRGNPRPFLSYPRNLFVATNGGGIRLPDNPDDLQASKDLYAQAAASGDSAASLKYVSIRAWELFTSRAYLHQYERYGLDSELLLDCFAIVEQIAHCYSSLRWT